MRFRRYRYFLRGVWMPGQACRHDILIESNFGCHFPQSNRSDFKGCPTANEHDRLIIYDAGIDRCIFA
jgi:hypothetical protein